MYSHERQWLRRLAIVNDYVRIPYANGSSYASQFLYREMTARGHADKSLFCSIGAGMDRGETLDAQCGEREPATAADEADEDGKCAAKAGARDATLSGEGMGRRETIRQLSRFAH